MSIDFKDVADGIIIGCVGALVFVSVNYVKFNEMYIINKKEKNLYLCLQGEIFEDKELNEAEAIIEDLIINDGRLTLNDLNEAIELERSGYYNIFWANKENIKKLVKSDVHDLAANVYVPERSRFFENLAFLGVGIIFLVCLMWTLFLLLIRNLKERRLRK